MGTHSTSPLELTMLLTADQKREREGCKTRWSQPQSTLPQHSFNCGLLASFVYLQRENLAAQSRWVWPESLSSCIQKRKIFHFLMCSRLHLELNFEPRWSWSNNDYVKRWSCFGIHTNNMQQVTRKAISWLTIANFGTSDKEDCVSIGGRGEGDDGSERESIVNDDQGGSNVGDHATST